MGHQLQGAMPERRALRVREAIAAYRIGKTKLYELMKSGDLRTVKIGGSRLIPVQELESLLASSRRGADPAPQNTDEF